MRPGPLRLLLLGRVHGPHADPRQGHRELAEHLAVRVGEAQGSRDPQVAARRRFHAGGRAYVEYVVAELGLFQVACRHDEGRAADADPYGVLQGCIEDLVTTGSLPRSRRRDAAAAAWAAVHGLGVLLTEGPLRRLPEDRRQDVVERTLDVVQRGL